MKLVWWILAFAFAETPAMVFIVLAPRPASLLGFLFITAIWTAWMWFFMWGEVE